MNSSGPAHIPGPAPVISALPRYWQGFIPLLGSLALRGFAGSSSPSGSELAQQVRPADQSLTRGFSTCAVHVLNPLLVHLSQILPLLAGSLPKSILALSGGFMSTLFWFLHNYVKFDNVYCTFSLHIVGTMWENLDMPRGRKTQPDYPGSLGSLLYDKRKANGWPAKRVADACGLSQTFIAAIERGARCPELDRVPDIALAYRLDVSLVCWTWIVQFAPRAAPYMVMPAYAHTVSDSEAETAMLLGMSASRGKVEAEVAAAIAERRRQRMAQVTRDPGTLAQEQARADERQAMLDAPLPEVAPSEPPMGSVIVGDRHENHPETSSGSGGEYIKDRETCKEHQNN